MKKVTILQGQIKLKVKVNRKILRLKLVLKRIAIFTF